MNEDELKNFGMIIPKGVHKEEQEEVIPEISNASELKREIKVKFFFESIRRDEYPRWCTAKGACACMGGYNCSNYEKALRQWRKLFQTEPYLTQEDIDNYNNSKPKPDVSYGFQSFKYEDKSQKSKP